MKPSAAFVLVISTIWLTGCTLFSKIDFPDRTCSTDTVDGSRVILGQCWSAEERLAFYSTSQGSHIAPYDLATFVELPDSNEPFLSPKNIEKWRYLPSDNPQENPWPIGFVKDSVPSGRFKGDWIGMNCSACHTAELHYQGKQYRIDGGPTLADKTGFINELDSALKETYEDGEKIPRPDGSARDGAKFARYANHFPNESRESLLERLKTTVDARQEWHKRNDYKINGQVTTQGHGRLDAFTLIFNEVNLIMGSKWNYPEGYNKWTYPEGYKWNYHDPSAPVSYPFLWGTHFHDWVQWNGISPASPTTRNVAQLFGSFGQVQLENKHQDLSHESTFRLGNQHKLENLVQTLRAPVWPKAFGEINKT